MTDSFEDHLRKNNEDPLHYQSSENSFVIKYRSYLRSPEEWRLFKKRVKSGLHVSVLDWRAKADQRYAGLPARNIEPAELVGAQSGYPRPEAPTAASDAQTSPNSRVEEAAGSSRADPRHIGEPMVGDRADDPVIEPEETNLSEVADSVRATERARRAGIMARFKSTAREQGIKVKYPKIAMAAKPGKWTERTPINWWMSVDPRLHALDAGRIERVLTQSPRTVWPNE